MKVRWQTGTTVQVREIQVTRITIEGSLVIFKDGQDGVLLMVPQASLLDAAEEAPNA